MEPLSRNLELKARVDAARARAMVQELPIRDHEVEHQIDPYCHAFEGCLKLRQINGEPAQLIWYQRTNRAQARYSSYLNAPVGTSNASSTLEQLLTCSLGQRGKVVKRREIYLWHNVRIHLDEVEGLGSFLELEAVIELPDQEEPSAERVAHLRERLDIRDEDLVAESYSDLQGL